MNPLPETFRSDGFEFRLLKRQGRVALFEKRKNGFSKYEVVIIQIVPETVFPDGRKCETHEAMPRSRDWGVLGWSPFDKEEAEAKFAQICLERPGLARISTHKGPKQGCVGCPALSERLSLETLKTPLFHQFVKKTDTL